MSELKLPSRGIVVLGTNTGVGKTCVSRGILRTWVRRGVQAVGIKPYETGCAPAPLDAEALRRAAGQVDPSREVPEGPWFRAAAPISPWAALLRQGKESPRVAIQHRLLELMERPQGQGLPSPRFVIETAGGVLSPLDDIATNADLSADLGGEDGRRCPAILVTRDVLGTLSTTWTALESLEKRRVTLVAIVVVQRPRRVLETGVSETGVSETGLSGDGFFGNGPAAEALRDTSFGDASFGDASCADNLLLMASRSKVPCLPFAWVGCEESSTGEVPVDSPADGSADRPTAKSASRSGSRSANSSLADDSLSEEVMRSGLDTVLERCFT